MTDTTRAIMNFIAAILFGAAAYMSYKRENRWDWRVTCDVICCVLWALNFLFRLPAALA